MDMATQTLERPRLANHHKQRGGGGSGARLKLDESPGVRHLDHVPSVSTSGEPILGEDDLDA